MSGRRAKAIRRGESPWRRIRTLRTGEEALLFNPRPGVSQCVLPVTARERMRRREDARFNREVLKAVVEFPPDDTYAVFNGEPTAS